MGTNDFFAELASSLSLAARKPNILSYQPNSPVHQKFHESQRIGRLLRGGNRSGKSVAGVVEMLWRATGKHPYMKVPEPPTYHRIVTVDKDAGIDQIIKPLLQQWIPPSELINSSWEDSYHNKKSLLTLRNGSVIEIKTHNQEIESFAGVPRHSIWFDEECPKAIFDECRLRLIDYNGCWYMTMTPVEGQDWIFDRFIVTNNKNVDSFEVSITDNPHLNQEALDLLDEDLSDEEKKVRKQGIFVPKGGLVLREFDRSRNVIPSIIASLIPLDWEIYCSLDHGYNNPTAILWHAVNIKSDVVTFREHYKAKLTIVQHVERINEINAEIGRIPKIYIGDPSMSQRSAITGTSPLDEYRRLGIPVMQAKKDPNGVAGRLNKMNEYLRQVKWKITEDCPNHIKENMGYSWKIYNSPKIADRNNVREEPNKKNDHTVDSSGYFFTLMPQLTPVQEKKSPGISATVTNREDFPWEIDSGFMQGNRDGAYEGLSFGEIY